MNLSLPILSSTAQRNRIPAVSPNQPGAFVISLDFELHWGVRDHRPLSSAECSRLLAARAAVPRILDLFEEFSISATWATVGILFARSRDEAYAFAPYRQPNYANSRLNAFREQLGKDETDDPFHFAPSLIAEIASRKGQEIGSHSFSHYYCMEPGQTVAEFEADIQSAVGIAANSGHTVRSYVFARNQVNPAYLPVLRQAGIIAYRANEQTAIKNAASFKEQQRANYRLGRLLDAYVDVCGPQISHWPQGPRPFALYASRYLRPHNRKSAMLEPMLLRRIGEAMKSAALRGEVFHVWFHPEDFAPFVKENLRLLRRVLQSFERHRTEYGMLSLSMAQLSGSVPFNA
jgi:peptidoglycan/xylan/chitin deacetylase (PgdA/CDA1 family)